MSTITQIGFEVNIIINCETEEEILSHLSAIRSRFKKELRKLPNGIPDGVDMEWDDDNCYGSHVVRIEPDFA